MNMIELPVAGEIMRINWDRSKFVSIIPKTSESSILVYDGMQIEIGMSATAFNQMMDAETDKDDLIEQINRMMQQYKFSGEFWMCLNRGEDFAQLIQVKWQSDVINVTGKERSRINCKTEISVSFLVNSKHAQRTRAVIYTKKHDMKMNESEAKMRQFILNSFVNDVCKIEDPDNHIRNLRWNCSDMYGSFKDINGGDGYDESAIPLYLYIYYGKLLISGAALKIELSRFGNIESNTIAYNAAHAMADAKLKAARIIALGPIICEKLRDQAMYKELSGTAGKFGYKYQADLYQGKADSAGKTALSMLY